MDGDALIGGKQVRYNYFMEARLRETYWASMQTTVWFRFGALALDDSLTSLQRGWKVKFYRERMNQTSFELYKFLREDSRKCQFLDLTQFFLSGVSWITRTYHFLRVVLGLSPGIRTFFHDVNFSCKKGSSGLSTLIHI